MVQANETATQLNPSDIKIIARDLALGAMAHKWTSVFTSPIVMNAEWINYFKDNWSHKATKYADGSPQLKPFFELLVSFEYFSVIRNDSKSNTIGYVSGSIPTHFYTLTQKAFNLLEKPDEALSIFVSYGRKQSSAFSLLVEARLKIADSQMGVFVDKSIRLATISMDILKTESSKVNISFACWGRLQCLTIQVGMI